MARKPVPKDIQTNVLLSSRRRCCICFGLNRDSAMKVGQIAHLDQNSSNNSSGNLAFLCFVHHDEYDSTTRQSKNYTADEIKAFRTELVRALEEAFAQPVKFGEVVGAVRRNSMIDGRYIRLEDGESSSAEIIISRIASRHSQYHVSGFALWGKKREYGPNIGEFDFIMELAEDRFVYSGKVGNHGPHRMEIKIDGDVLSVSEENWLGQYGMNVHFMGTYKKSD
jgi:hypothetical protein